MTAAVYLAAMGPEGLRSVAEACHAKAAYLREQLAAAGLEPVHGGAFFHEFLTQCPVAPEKLLDALKERESWADCRSGTRFSGAQRKRIPGPRSIGWLPSCGR